MNKLAQQSAGVGAAISGLRPFLPASGPLTQRLRLATIAAADANSEGMAITMLTVKGKLDQAGVVPFRRALDVPAAWAQA